MHGQVLMTYILILSLEWAAVGLVVFGLICLVRRVWDWLKRKQGQKAQAQGEEDW